MNHIPARQARIAAEFDAARRDMLAAWRKLCRAGIGKDDAAGEAWATTSAMRQLFDLENAPDSLRNQWVCARNDAGPNGAGNTARPLTNRVCEAPENG